VTSRDERGLQKRSRTGTSLALGLFSARWNG